MVFSMIHNDSADDDIKGTKALYYYMYKTERNYDVV